MGPVDLITLLLILSGGLHLGLLGAFGWDAFGSLTGSYVSLLYVLVGASAVWQICRQRF